MTMEVDDVLVEIGGFGRSQRIILVVYCFTNVTAAMVMLLNIFIGQSAVITGCQTKADITTDFCTSSCPQFSYANGTGFSISTEWDLVCDRESMIASTQSFFMLGMCIGSLFSGPIADAYGRYRIILFCTIMNFVFNSLTAVSTSWLTHTISRFCAGLPFTGIMNTGFVLTTEVLGPSQRPLAGSLPALAFALGECLLAFFAWLLPQWRSISMSVASMSLIQIPLVYWCLCESPRWHLRKGREQDALRLLQTLARRNGTHLATVDLKVEEDRSARKRSALDLSMDLIRSSVLRKLTLIKGLTWFTNSLVYYGLTFSAGSIGSNIYSNVALMAAFEIPANLLALVIMKRYPRARSTSFFMLLSGAALLATMMAPFLLKSLVIFAKSAITVSFAIIYVHAGEAYPTGVRNVSMTALSLFNRFGGVVAPMTVAIMMMGMDVHLLLYGALAILSGFAHLWLPETFNKPLPDTEEDVVNLYVTA